MFFKHFHTQALFGSKNKQDKFGPRPDEKLNNQKFIEREQQQQMTMMHDQDREMEAVATTVVNLKEIATVMGNELDEQSRYVPLDLMILV